MRTLFYPLNAKMKKIKRLENWRAWNSSICILRIQKWKNCLFTIFYTFFSLIKCCLKSRFFIPFQTYF